MGAYQQAAAQIVEANRRQRKTIRRRHALCDPVFGLRSKRKENVNKERA